MFTHRSLLTVLLLLCGMLTQTSGTASEVSLHAGALRGDGAGTSSGNTYSWALEYRHPLGENFSASFSWLNEGHLRDHHRDGQAVQVWWHGVALWSGFIPEFGIGPYRYYDTASLPGGRYANRHGWGVLASAGGRWQIDRHWSASLRLNRVQAGGEFDSTALLAGVGYRFGPAASTSPEGVRSPAFRSSRTAIEMGIGAGRSIVNSFDSEGATAKAIALRIRSGGALAGSLTLLDEGRPRGQSRRGIAAQVWLESDLSDRLSVAAGIGPYAAIDREDRPDGSRPDAVTTLVSVSAAYALSPRWLARATWNRVVTRDSSDSDVILLGAGYRF